LSNSLKKVNEGLHEIEQLRVADVHSQETATTNIRTDKAMRGLKQSMFLMYLMHKKMLRKLVWKSKTLCKQYLLKPIQPLNCESDMFANKHRKELDRVMTNLPMSLKGVVAAFSDLNDESIGSETMSDARTQNHTSLCRTRFKKW